MFTKTSMALAALLAAAAAFSAPAAAAGQEDGMVVVRDARTGKLRNPTPAEVKALRAQQAPKSLVARDAIQEAVTIRPNGTLHKRLGERSMVYSVIRRDAGGKLGMQCVKGEPAANAALERPAPAAAPHQEHDHESR